ncbi:MAG: hypothetical protein ACKO7D_06960 [Bacteroidota bacterium]
MKKNRILIALLILLIISNAFTIFLLVQRKHHRNHPPFISEKIGLTGQKLEKVKKMEESHFEKMKPLVNKIHSTQAEILSTIGNSNNIKQDSLKNILTQLESNRQTILLEHFKSIYQICDSNEREKLVNEINQHFSKQKHPR